jgi:hypothetical protein
MLMARSIDPLLAGTAMGTTWNPASSSWETVEK